MGKRLDVNEYIGKIFKNKIDESYEVLTYLFKQGTNHCFDIKFIETGNIQMATLNQIRAGTCLDLVHRKKLKRIKTELELRERNKLIKKAKSQTVIPDDLDEKNVLSIDLASRSVGIAYSKKGEIVRWKTIKAEDPDFRTRGYHICKEIVEIMKRGKIDTVILEDIYLGLNSNILTMLAELRGMLTYHVKELGIDLLTIPAILWKNKYIDCPSARAEQKKYMMDKFEFFTGTKADSDDVADAYCMLKGVLI